MSRVLLVDTNFSSAPIYNFLVQAGYEVYVTGNNPGDFLARTAARYININYSDLSEARRLVGRLNIDFIVPGCNDLSYAVCSDLNSDGDYFCLDSTEATETINNKKKFREFALTAGLPVPQTFAEDEAGECWPLIAKPVDAYSGRGITVIRGADRNEFRSAVDCARKYSRSGECLLEEYVQGQLYSHTAFIRDGNILMDFIVEEHGTANPFVVDTSRVVFDFSGSMLHEIRAAITLLVGNLRLVDGLVHTQFIRNGGKFWIIEITRRCPGDLYSLLIELSTGWNYAGYYAAPFVDMMIEPCKDRQRQSWIMRHTISRPEKGIFNSIHFNFPLHIEMLWQISNSGDMVDASPFGRIGILFSRSESKQELDSLFAATLDRKFYSIN